MTRRKASPCHESLVFWWLWSRNLLICILLLALIGTLVGRLSKVREDLVQGDWATFQWWRTQSEGLRWAMLKASVCFVFQKVVGGGRQGGLWHHSCTQASPAENPGNQNSLLAVWRNRPNLCTFLNRRISMGKIKFVACEFLSLPHYLELDNVRCDLYT